MSKEAKAYWRAIRTQYINEFTENTGYKVHWFEPWHCRVEDMLDLYPTNGRYFIVETEVWGDWHTYEDLYKILQEHNL